MALIQTVHLSMANFKSAPVVPAVQNDTDRQLKMIVDDFDLTSGMTGKIAFQRSDGTHYETSATLNTSDNSFTADIDQALTQPGRTMVQLKVTDTLTVSTFSFVIFVEQDNSGTVTPQEGIDLVSAVQAAEDAADRAEEAAESLELDATLTSPTKAAQAKAVGEFRDQYAQTISGVQTFYGLGNFDHYGLNATGAFNTTQKYRVSCDNSKLITFDHDVVVHVNPLFEWGYYPFVGGVIGTWSGWKSSDFTIPANTSFIVQISRKIEDSSEIADVNTFINAVTFIPLFIDNTLTASGRAADAKATGDAISGLENDFNTSLYGGDFTAVTWVDGFIYNDVVSTNSGWQMTTPFFMKKGEVLTFTGGKGDTVLPINAVSSYDNGTYSLVKSYNGTGSESISYTAPSDMYAIVSVKKDIYSNDLKVAKIGDIEVINSKIDSIPSYVFNSIQPTQLTISAGSYAQYHIDSGKTYLVENNRSNNLTLATRTDPSGYTIDSVNVPNNSLVKFTATGNADYIVSAVSADISISTEDTLLPFIKKVTKALGNYGDNVPLVSFIFDKNMFDFTSELNGIDFFDNTGQGGWYLIPEIVTAKFDSLVSAHSSYVSKVDAGADVGLTYPAYANLGGVASGNYRATPTYKTYLYKFETNNVYVNGSLNKKKKLLLIGATHGSETAGAFNLYLFAKNLCECANEDYFKLRSAYDVYIIPCLNGYGMYHLTRWNADGVNINRNYPISNFEVDGQPYDDDYTGASAGSEFETQIVVRLQEKYGFDVAIDHHNYGSSDSQFYTESWYERFRPLSNSALVDCAYSFIRNKPTYFGTDYQLFVNVANSTMPNVVLSDSMPCMAKWFFEQDVDYSATIEISNTINYGGGALNPSADNPKYTADVFAVGEFTLRNQLLHYCGFVLGGTGN